MQWAAANLLVLSRVLAANIGVVEGRVSRLGRYGDDEILVRQFVFGCGSGSCNGRFCGGNDGCGESVEPVFLNVLYISVCFQWYCGSANGCVGGFVVVRFGCGGILELLRDGAAQGVAAVAGSVFSARECCSQLVGGGRVVLCCEGVGDVGGLESDNSSFLSIDRILASGWCGGGVGAVRCGGDGEEGDSNGDGGVVGG